MPDLIKTLESWREPAKLDRFFSGCAFYFFTLGRGRPSRLPVEKLWFTHRGRLLGYFEILNVEKNDGQFPLLRTMDGKLDTWQIKPDRWVAVCCPPFHPLREKIFHSGFRGWRYFDYVSYTKTMDAKIRV